MALFMAGLLLVCREGRGLAVSPPPAPDRGELVGIWGGQRDFGPRVRGALTIRKEGAQWRAEIAGERLDAAFENGELAFEVPGHLGSFRGRVETSGIIRGQWIQPGVVSMFGERFSTPVALTPAGTSLWRGTVHPLHDRNRIYLVIDSDEEGRTPAFLRNPEVNFGRHFDITDVRRHGDTVQLWGTPAGRKDGKTILLTDGLYRDSRRMLSIFIDDLGGTYDLERVEDDTVSDFYPRSWARGAYQYHPPAARDDGWDTADLQRVGMAVGPIEALIRKIISTPMNAIDAPWIDAVLIARHGKLVLEEYFHGQGADRTHDTRSASKSLTTTLVGAAVHAGLVSLKSGVYRVMNGGVLPKDLDPRASRMTLEHLITMSSGLACDDWTPSSPGGEDRMQSQTLQPDWNRYILDLPMTHEPGEHAAYCSGGMGLAGGVVSRAAGVPLTVLFDRYLARPLRMGVYHTNLMPNGEAYAGGGLRITARDFLKFGQLMLQDGRWNGRTILDAGWSEAATTARHDLGGKHIESYGYGWWLIDYELDGRRWKAFYAGGNGGNYIIDVPELDLAIVFFGSNYNQSVQHETKYDYVPEFILRSIVDGERQAAG
jgi:CubicO group peptidase (beta-lactamase class C family)